MAQLKRKLRKADILEPVRLSDFTRTDGSGGRRSADLLQTTMTPWKQAAFSISVKTLTTRPITSGSSLPLCDPLVLKRELVPVRPV